MRRNKIVLTAVLLGMSIWMSGCGKENMETVDKADINEAENIEATEKEEPQVQQDSVSSEPAGRIICWGDSLTYGQGGNDVTYPLVLADMLNYEVINYGIQGETAKQIAIRAGALTMTTSAFEIPADTTPVEMYLWQNGQDPIMMRLGDCAINPCVIGGVEGTLSYDAEQIKYYFTRTSEGEAVQIEDGTVVETFASLDKRESDIIVLFAGTNLPPDKDTVGELIDTEQKMLDYLGSDRYVVIGLTSKILIPDVEPINEALAGAFGEHFLDIRTYMLEHGLEDAGLEITEQDQEDIENGEIPFGLRVDEVHGNEAFYRIIGEQVCRKLEELGYITEKDKR